MSGTRGRKQRPWRTLRCVVEVKVPLSNGSTEKDLIYQVNEGLADNFSTHFDQYHMPLPRTGRTDANRVRFTVKSYVRVAQAERQPQPEPVKPFEKLVARALYAIIMLVLPRTHTARKAVSMLREDLTDFVKQT